MSDYANEIEISIFTERSGLLRLEVSDDGADASRSRGSGLAGLAQRVSTVDGRLEVSGPAGSEIIRRHSYATTHHW